MKVNTECDSRTGAFTKVLRRWLASVVILVPMAQPACAGGGPLGIDHEIAFDQNGVWARKYQTGLAFGVIASEIGGALWLGNDDSLGHVFWQTIDSSILTGVASTALKKATGRARPDQGNDPNKWFRGGCCESFPSGEVSLQASFVTPFIVRYSSEHPWVWALELLPLYDGTARLKSHAHWQTDVLAGWLLGSGVGYWSAKRATPISVSVLPGGLSVGIYKRF